MAKTNDEIALELNDNHSVKVLICYLLKNLGMEITEDELYEISITSGIINYFHFTEALNTLYRTQAIVKNEADGKLTITNKGIYSVSEFKQYVPRSFRDKILNEALLYFARKKREKEVICSIKENENGYTVEFSLPDGNMELINLRLYAPDLASAEMLKEKISLNHTGLYGKILGFVLENTEEIPEIKKVSDK